MRRRIEEKTMLSTSFDFLWKFTLLLNSAHEVRSVIRQAIDLLKVELNAEAASVFLKQRESNELTFWAVKGGGESVLEGRKIPLDRGIVGWVVQNLKPAHVADASKDERFMSSVDKQSGFVTRDVLCVPLLVRGTNCIGALQVLNSRDSGFREDALSLLEHCGAQLALSIENARLIERLTEHALKLEALDKRRDQMISVIAHELRTPLNIIQMSAEMLRLGCADEHQRDKMEETLKSGVRRLTKLAGQLKTLSHSTSNPLEMRKTAIDLGALVKDCAKQFEEPCKKRNLELKINVDDKDLRVDADYALLRVVVGNLVSNAIRFTRDQGKIEIAVHRELDMVRVEVIDTGIGIAADQVSLIFEKFYEVQHAINHSSGEFEFMSGGLGLGLATVRTLAAAHGTKVNVESEPGKGSKFYFSLPAAEV